jgi:predicted metal-dependent phosphoesterase TrpH
VLEDLTENYVPPGRESRECKYWWFDGWDWLVNSALALAGGPRIVVEPGSIAIDPHVHSLFSHCSISDLSRLLARSARLGLSAIAIMDHNTSRGSAEAIRCSEFMKRRGELPEHFVVVPGLEVNSSAGHIGALFVEREIEMGLSPSEVLKIIREEGGLSVAVHPYHSTGVGDAVFDHDFDSVEVESGAVFERSAAERCRALSGDPRLAHVACIGSSDAHYVAAIGSCHTILDCAHGDPELIRDCIIQRRVRAVRTASYDRTRRLLGGVAKLR